MPRKRVKKSEAEAAFSGASRLSALADVAKKAGDWEPGLEALSRVRAVPTMFPQLNLATRCGGWPIERFCMVHGPSNHGKTVVLHGIGASFLALDHMYAYVDAEMTTPEDWVVKLLGKFAQHPGFVAQRPKSYEQTVDSVRALVEGIADKREKKEIPADTTALVVVDSIRKLVPRRLMEAIAALGAQGKKGNKEGSIDGMSGRAAMYKAALNGQWLDELTPLLYHTGTALVFVAREIENTERTGSGGGFDDVKVTGGKGIYFDSSLAMRITRAEWIMQGSKDSATVVGERHRLTIHKTKVGGKDGRVATAHVHTSNGELIPEGFDLARDYLELAMEFNLVEQENDKSAWLTWKSTGQRWNGRNQAVKDLTDTPQLLKDFKIEVETASKEERDERSKKNSADQDVGNPS